VTIASIEPEEVRQRRADGETVFLLDVREPDEVEAWAYPDAMTIPMGEIPDRLAELPRNETIVVACHLGGRSAQVTEFLNANGFTAVNLTGGAVRWAATEDNA
jgi:rhodanese-related sulfurtransferase